MTIEKIKAPVWDADGFSDDEEEQERSFRQYEAYQDFYNKLLPRIKGLGWRTEEFQYVFSKDTITGGFRVSVFDKKGAIRHSARNTVGELFQHESFPYNGCWLFVVTD